MKLNILLLPITILFFVSCKKSDSDIDTDLGYPDGISVVDKATKNDCSLPECSSDRVIRMLAKNVKVKTVKVINGVNAGKYAVSYKYSFDSSINFYFCEIPEGFKQENLLVEFSGNVIDACGIIDAIWPVEEVYLIKLTKIQKQ